MTSKLPFGSDIHTKSEKFGDRLRIAGASPSVRNISIYPDHIQKRGLAAAVGSDEDLKWIDLLADFPQASEVEGPRLPESSGVLSTPPPPGKPGSSAGAP